MRTILTTLLIFLLSVTYSQKLPEMVIDPNILKNSMEVWRYQYPIQDTAYGCFNEGHYVCTPEVVDGTAQCKVVRGIRYDTMLWNDGDSVAYYGNTEIDTNYWHPDSCHNHMHHDKGIMVTIERFENNAWNVISVNQKLDYDMTMRNKYPAGFVTEPRSGTHYLVVDNRVDLDWYTQYSPIDSTKAKWRDTPASGGADTFYLYPDVYYGSVERGMLQYWGDLYSKYFEGNSNNLLDSVDGFHRLKAWHDAPFPQRNLFPDTVEIIFYLAGDNIIHDTVPTIVELDTVPDFILAQTTNGPWGNRVIEVPGMDYPGIIYRHWVKGNAIQNGGVPIPVSGPYVYDALAPANEFHVYKRGGKVSNKVKFK